MARNGYRVFHGETDAWGTVENNAKILLRRVDEILAETGAVKVNIIAHSRGGLEARYLISSLGQSGRIASLTTISTPHHGVKAMNIVLVLPVPLYRFFSYFVDFWYKILGDKNPDFFHSSRQLSEKVCREFNVANPDRDCVYYQSYASKLKYYFSDIMYIIMNPFLLLTDGENDGLCPVESAKWGIFRGVITTRIFGISHSGIIDAYRIKYREVDIPEFYLSILEDLASKGF